MMLTVEILIEILISLKTSLSKFELISRILLAGQFQYGKICLSSL